MGDLSVAIGKREPLWTKIVLLSVVLGSLALVLGAGFFVIVPGLIASGSHALWILAGRKSTEVETSLPHRIVDKAIGRALEETNAIAEHIKEATEMGVMSAAENAAEISSRIGLRSDDMDGLSKNTGALVRVVEEQHRFFDEMQESFDVLLQKFEEEPSSTLDAASELNALFGSRSAEMQELARSTEGAIVAASESWQLLLAGLEEDDAYLKASADQIMVELQFQDKIRQELERLQQQARVPVDVLRDLAAEIASGNLPSERYETRTDELQAVAAAQSVETAHALCAGEDDVTGEFEAF